VADLLRITDCRGRDVAIDEETWRKKIVLDHAELDGNEAAVERTLVDPDVRNRDKTHIHREVFYRSGVLPPPYHVDMLKVVVEFRRCDDGAQKGRVVTAFAVDRVARGEKRIWTRPQLQE
jgi:hypothetical protein